jgi:RNA polymerase sigma-70 factor (ECF subfamily)
MVQVWKAEREQALVAAIQAGDTTAYTEVYQALYRALHHTAQRIVRSPELADDAVQDVFLRLWRRRTTWVVRDTIAACLHRAVRNRAFDLLRRERRKRPPSIEAIRLPRSPQADDAVAETELRDTLHMLLARLSPRGRQVFLLSLRGDQTYADIGEHCGIARNTVRINLIESRRRLYRGLLDLGLLDA